MSDHKELRRLAEMPILGLSISVPHQDLRDLLAEVERLRLYNKSMDQSCGELLDCASRARERAETAEASVERLKTQRDEAVALLREIMKADMDAMRELRELGIPYEDGLAIRFVDRIDTLLSKLTPSDEVSDE